MGTITTKCALFDYIKRRLGYPTISPIIDDTQLEDIVTDAILKFKTYAIGEAVVRGYTVITTEDGVTDYALNSNINAVVQAIGTRSLVGGINTLWSFESALFRAGALDFRNFDIISFVLTTSYLEMFQQIVQPRITVQYNKFTKKVTILPTPDSEMYVLLEVFVDAAETEEQMYDHPFIRDFSAACAMVQMGINTAKFGNVTLPGGSTINSAFYITEGNDMKAKILEKLTTDYSDPIDFFVG